MRPVPSASPFALHPWVLRLLLMVPTVTAIALVWHATTRLTHVQREMADLETQNGRLYRDMEIVPRFDAPMVRTIGSTTVTLVPATLDVRPAIGQDADARPVYQRLLDLCLQLSTQTNRADLMQISVQTGSNSVSRATVSFSLWTQEAAQ